MSEKIFYFDVETTGLDPDRHAIVQLACIIEIPGGPIIEREFRMRPFENDDVDQKALEINKLTTEEILTYPDPAQVFRNFRMLLEEYVDRFDRTDKFIPAGYNVVNFDMNFLRRWFLKCDDKYFGSYFRQYALDPFTLLPWLTTTNRLPQLPNYKLVTVCDYFDVALGEKAHDALADIRATRRLIVNLRQQYFPAKLI